MEQLKNVEVGTIFMYKGIEFIKLSDEKKKLACYCVCTCSQYFTPFNVDKFDNNWSVSTLRRKLNKFDKAGHSLILEGITRDDLVKSHLNYYGYNNPNGHCEDYITLLSFEEYICYIDLLPHWGSTWLRSGAYGNASFARCLSTSGSDLNYNVDGTYAVRPALRLKSNIFVEVVI